MTHRGYLLTVFQASRPFLLSHTRSMSHRAPLHSASTAMLAWVW